MKSMQAYSWEKTQTVWTETIKRLLHHYFEYRNRRRALRRGAENSIMTPYEGRRWCDATERELISDITNRNRSHF
jgi:hypothetical protein